MSESGEGERPAGGEPRSRQSDGRAVSGLRRFTVHALSLAWMGVITVTLLLPRNPDLGDHFRWLPVRVDRAAHFLLFFICCLLLHRSARFERLQMALPAAAVASLGYGALTESLQLLLPERSFELADGIANAAGVAVYVGWALVRSDRWE